MYFQHDGTLPHSSRNVRNLLKIKIDTDYIKTHAMYPNRWIGHGGPHNWPAIAGFNTAGFFFLGHLKNYIYREPIQSRRELNDRILEALATITPNMIHNVSQNLLRRARLCIQINGTQFEHLL